MILLHPSRRRWRRSSSCQQPAGVLATLVDDTMLSDRYSRRRVAIMAIVLIVSLRPSRTFGQRPIVQGNANQRKAADWVGLGGFAVAEAVQTDEYIQGR
jgi:hypothetical protein